MPTPIVFISHFRVKAGKADAYRNLQREIAAQLDAGKPRTLVFLTYLDDAGTTMTAVHVFADPEAMDLHFEGADDRSKAAYEFLIPNGWEIYGTPSAAALGTIREAASAAHVPLKFEPQHVAGFLRVSG
jgi:hypothetical protein